MEMDENAEEKYDVPLFTIGLTSSHVSFIQVQLELVLDMPRSFFATPVADEAEMPLPGEQLSEAASFFPGSGNAGQAAASLAELPPSERSSTKKTPSNKELGAGGSVSAIGFLFRGASGASGHSEVPLRKKSRPPTYHASQCAAQRRSGFGKGRSRLQGD
mmetsp:Transcript_67180/g.218725  ORF Transcript_67180/g.218725 Transcript_67180/m.218725 type:complete len:160 (-) Transcript_67180:234-713(-)